MFRDLWRWIQARFRLDMDVVCEMSKGRGPCEDFHDYPDDVNGQPIHWHEMTCKRCGKNFFI